MQTRHTQDTPLPEDVRAALDRGQTIEAIKRLREARGVDLKTAHDIVRAHQRGRSRRPTAGPEGMIREASTGRRFLALAVAAALLFLAYWLIR